MTSLSDDTQLLLAIDPNEYDPSLEDALTSLSEAVVTQLALTAKARSYQARIDRGLALAANRGASLDELAAAAGIGPQEVLERLRSAPAGLIGPATRTRLNLDSSVPATGGKPTPGRPAPGKPAAGKASAGKASAGARQPVMASSQPPEGARKSPVPPSANQEPPATERRPSTRRWWRG